MAGDYLQAAKDALGDGIDSRDEQKVRLANTHALIAIAEGIRALVGAIAAIPILEDIDGDSRD